jgi:hypothetical protein
MPAISDTALALGIHGDSKLVITFHMISSAKHVKETLGQCHLTPSSKTVVVYKTDCQFRGVGRHF